MDIPDIDTIIDMPEAIDAVARLVLREFDGQAQNIPKTVATWPPASSAHALGAIDQVDGLVAFKVWINTPQGAAAILNLFDITTGSHVVSMEAGALGMYRTAAIAGLATRVMSDEGADDLALLGTGRQAFHQVLAVHAVRPLRRLRVWSPTENHREAFARRVQDDLGIAAEAASTVEEALAGAPLVTTICRASEPFVRADMLAPGAHVNAMGAILPQAAEIDASVLDGADVIAVDNVANAEANSRELREFVDGDWSSVVTLGSLLAVGDGSVRGKGFSVFKGMGMGLSDLAVAAIIAKKMSH